MSLEKKIAEKLCIFLKKDATRIWADEISSLGEDTWAPLARLPQREDCREGNPEYWDCRGPGSVYICSLGLPCDSAPVLQLSCTDTSTLELESFVYAVLNLMSTLMLIIVSYSYILRTILRTPVAQ